MFLGIWRGAKNGAPSRAPKSEILLLFTTLELGPASQKGTPFWYHFGDLFCSKNKKGGSKNMSIWGSSGRASARFLVQRVSKKDAKRTSKRGFGMLIYYVSASRASLKNLLFWSSLGYQSEVKTEIHKMKPSKHILGGSDGHLGPPKMILGSPLGPFGATGVTLETR